MNSYKNLGVPRFQMVAGHWAVPVARALADSELTGGVRLRPGLRWFSLSKSQVHVQPDYSTRAPAQQP